MADSRATETVEADVRDARIQGLLAIQQSGCCFTNEESDWMLGELVRLRASLNARQPTLNRVRKVLADMDDLLAFEEDDGSDTYNCRRWWADRLRHALSGGEREDDAWLMGPPESELKRCPRCMDLALEGQAECSECGASPSDDSTWRENRARLIRPASQPSPEPTKEHERHGWATTHGVTCVSCPDCAFTFDAAHEDVRCGGYSCPACDAPSPEPGEPVADVGVLREALKEVMASTYSGDDVALLAAGLGNVSPEIRSRCDRMKAAHERAYRVLGERREGSDG